MAKEAYRIDISVAVDDRSEPALSKIEGKVSKLDKSVERTRKQLERMNRTRWQMAVHIADRASDVLVAINARVQSISGKTFRFTVRVLDYASRPLRMIGRLVSGGMALLGPALGAAASGLAGLFQTAAKFEQSMANVRMVTHANAQDFAALNQRARELGTSMPFTATQVADAMGSLAGAGFTAKQVLAGIGPTLLLASAGQMDLAEAANLASGVLFGMRMPAAQLDRVVDVMAKTAATANTSISQLGSAFSLAAPAAADANIAIEQMSAAIGVLSSHGIQGERAGKAMRLMLMQLNDTSSPAAKKLKAMGLELWDAQHAFKGLTPFMAEVERKGLRLADVAHAFGTETADAASILLNMGSESFAAYVKQLEQAQGAAKKMSKIQEDTLLGSIRRLSGAWEGIAISIGVQAVPALRAWIDRIAEAFTQSNGLADMIGGKINHVFTKLLDIMDSDAWNNAGVFGKIRLLWDEIVVAPFNEWWSGGGRERVIEAAHKIGAALGGALGGYLMGVFGMASKDADVDASPFVQAGSTAGRAFLEAFLEAFDAGKIVGKALEAFKNLQPTWLGGDTSSPLGQTLALMMDAWLLSKTVQVLGKGKQFYKNARKWIGGGSSATMAETTATAAPRTARAGTSKRSPWYRRWLRGSAAADAMPGPAAQFPADYRPAGKRYWRTIPLDRTYRRDEVVRMANAGQLGRYSELEKAFGGPAPMSSWRQRLLGNAAKQTGRLGRIASAASSGVRLLGRAFIGLTGPIGAVMTVVSLAGSAWSWYKQRQEEAEQRLIHMGDGLRAAAAESNQALQKSRDTQALIDEYRELDDAVGRNADSSGELAAKKERLADITATLRDMYPDLISAHDAESGKMSDRIGTIEKEIELEDKLARMKLAQAVADGKGNLPSLMEKIGEMETDFSNYEKQFELAHQVRQGLQDILLEWEALPEYSRTDANREALIQRANKIGELVGENFSNNGMSGVWAVFQQYEKQASKALEKYDAIGADLKAARQSVEEYYKARKLEIELDFGGDIAQGAARLETMLQTLQALQQSKSPSAEQLAALKDTLPILSDSSATAADKQRTLQSAIDQLKSSLIPAIDQLRLLNQEVTILPSDKKINVEVLYQQSGIEQPKLPKQTFMFDFFANLNEPKFPMHANGGLVTRPHIGLVGEAGPEMIVPLSPGKRARGLSLWQQAGYMLGVQPYAMGGMAGGPQMNLSAPALTEEAGLSTASSSKSLGGIHLGGVTLNFTLEGSSDNLLDSLRRNGEEIADYIGGVIAQKIEDAAQNRV
ncbi:phage tail tape measure protein [Paenibacillus dendritiformis]|uniref:phage tail tape measure protein n=1 Tax=Paenibacillus dendritiformis TaxID=130049 RepID=UPI001059E8C4|nr:phage tail tape measure protein [Paenibacillus dendritiformis]TDL57536.1 phage tail tape measure protein [Paenibacillus dendritiformis]